MELFELDKQKKKEPKRITKNHRTESHSEKMFYILGNETF